MATKPPKFPSPPPVPNFLVRLPKILAGIVVLILLLSGLFSSFYTVPAESQAVVLRFGKPIRTSKPGLHFKIPFGVDKSYAVQVERQMKQEFGFGTDNSTNPWQYGAEDEQEQEKNMVTGDLNAALVEWVVQYRIDDPMQYLFEVESPDAALRDLSENVMREVVGDRTVDEVITIGRQEIETIATQKLQEATRSYEMGLRIDQIQLKNVNPPRRVQGSFNEVNNALQEKESAINIANGEYNKAVPLARGEADRMISAAEGYAMKRVNEAEGDVASFEALLKQYSTAPDVTRRRIYLETMSEILPNIGRTVMLDEDAKGLLPLLNLGGSATTLPEGGAR
ncbi:MAG: FtsH protease activity modulator HflK [Akkermansiaceae bacterium]|nr:FtsH protease activity modulator HflK [Akkermansiaceae bacterium]